MEQTYTVLVAEDHDIQRKMLVDFCSRAMWSVVGAVSSSAHVISEYITHRPDVILIDIHLNKSDGISALKALQEQGHQPFVIFVTGSLDPEHEKACSELNTVAFITKPYTMMDIHKALHKVAAQLQLCK